MASFDPKFEVQKGRTVNCLQGTVHEGGKLTTASFSGDDNDEKQKKIVAIVKTGAMKPVPLTEAEEAALAKFQEEQKASEVAALEAAKADDARKDAILEADLDDMNKQPMIDFAEENEIELKGKTADEIRAELKAFQESLTAPE